MKLTSVFLTVILTTSVLLAGLSVVLPNAGAVDLSTPPEMVNDISSQKTSIDTFVTDSGRIYTVWNDKRGVDFDIYLSYSSNNGTTFSNSVLVNSNTTGNQLNPRVAVNDAGVIFVVWQDMTIDAGDIKLAKSNDGGETFGDSVTVNTVTDGTQAYPDLSVHGNDITVVWEEPRYEPSIKLWNPDTGALIREMDGHNSAVRCAAFSPDGARLISGGEDDMAKVWNPNTGALITNLTDHDGDVMAVNWTTDGNTFATGSWDYNVTLWNAADYSIVRKFNQADNGTATHEVRNPVNSIAFSPDATQTAGQIAVAYNGILGGGMPTGEPTEMFNLTVWNLTDSSNWTANEDNGGHTGSVTGAAFSHNGTYIATCSKDARVKIWNATSTAKFADVNLGQGVLSVCWSPDDTQLAAGLKNGTVVIFNFTNPANRTWLKGHTGRVNAVSWSEPRDELASGAADPSAKTWDLANETEAVNLTPHLNSVYAIDWAPSGNYLATASGNSLQYQMGESQIFTAFSTDSGLSFADAEAISDSNAGMRHRPKVEEDGTGTISVVWYDLRDGIEQIYYTNSTDGVTYGVNTNVAENLGKVQNVPDLAVEKGNGKVHVVWQYDQGTSIHYANSSDGFQNGKEISASGQLPRISTSTDGDSTWVTWRDSGVKLNISYDHGDTFTDLTDVNGSSVSDISIATDSFGQTSISWLTSSLSWDIYHVSSVLTDTWRPTITGTIPANSATGVSVFTQVQFNFSEPMDRQSVEDAFSISNGTALGADDCSDVYWSNYGDKVIFTLTNPLDYLEAYVVTIASTASDLSGNSLASPYVFSFNTRDDLDAPTILHIQTVFQVGYDEAYAVEATVVDWWGSVNTVNVHYMGVGGTSFQQLAMTHQGNDVYSAEIPAQNDLGNVSYYIRATDNHGNSGVLPANTSQYFSYSVVDEVAPEISHAPVAEWSVFKPVVISAHVEDEIELDSVQLMYAGVNLTVGNLNMTFNGTSNFYEATIPAQNDVGTVVYWIRAVDGSGNQNITNNYSLTITDLTAPLINSVTAEHRANHTEVLVRANVTDDVAIAEVTLFFKAVGGDHWVVRNMPLVSGNVYEFTIPSQSRSGTIYYYVNATDTSENLASTLSEADEFSIEVVGTGTNWMMYIVLGIILAVLVIVLVYLVMMRMKGKKPAQPRQSPSAPETKETEEEIYPDEEVDTR